MKLESAITLEMEKSLEMKATIEIKMMRDRSCTGD